MKNFDSETTKSTNTDTRKISLKLISKSLMRTLIATQSGIYFLLHGSRLQ